MKTFVFFFLAAIALGCGSTQPVTNYSEASILKAVENKEYIFVATQMIPQRGRTFNLNSYYDVVVSEDSVISFLPYFGRAHTAPVNPADGGITFTSTNFTYSSTTPREGRWEIKIRPEDETSVLDMLLTVFKGGSAYLSVNFINRTPVSFNGYVIPRND